MRHREWGAPTNRMQFIALACCLSFLAPAAWSGDSLLYSVGTAGDSSGRHLPLWKTEIFAVDQETGKQRLIFSDAGADFILLPGGSGTRGAIAAAGGHVFSVGMDRKAYSVGGFAGRWAIYELSTDSSNKARKLFDIEWEPNTSNNFANLFVSPSGSKIGHTNYLVLEKAVYLFIHDTTTGKLLQKTDISGNPLAEATAIGWMPDDKTVFFTCALAGDEDDTSWTAPNSPVGSYLLRDDYNVAVSLAPEREMHPKIPGLQADPEQPAVLIGGLPDGRFIVRDIQQGPASAHPGTYLYTLDLATKAKKIFPMTVDGQTGSFRLSNSGRELALTVMQRENEGPTNTPTDTVGFWIFDLESASQKKLLSFTIKQDGPPWVSLIGWLDNCEACR